MRVGQNLAPHHSSLLEPESYALEGDAGALEGGMARIASFLVAVPATAVFVTLSVAVLLGRVVVETTRRAVLKRAHRNHRPRFAQPRGWARR